MSKSSVVRARIEPNVKKTAEKILNKLGLSTSEAFNLFYHQIILKNGIPFEIKIPNFITKKTFEDSDKNKNIKTFKNKKELFDDLGI